MNILLISQCSKNALTETRRILDQFAERRGDRTWQTAITQQGMETLHKMLRKTARKNTAVACHWIRARDHSELVWVVGDMSRFNAQGATPTNMTARDVLRRQDENDWHTAEEIRLLSSLAALFHDLGKASKAFQEKLRSSAIMADAYRHEWVSLRLFEAFVGNSCDEEWLDRLALLPQKNEMDWIKALHRDGIDRRPPAPFKNMPSLAQIIGWLIVSHHRLPTQVKGTPQVQPTALTRLPSSIEDQWCGVRIGATPTQIKDCWSFNNGLPFASRHWRKHVSRVAQAIRQRSGMLTTDWCKDSYVAHLSRMALMLADHYYSSEPSHARYGDTQFPLYANTDRKTNVLKQRLDEHLIGVEVHASRIVRALPRLAQQLPHIAHHKGFRRRSQDERFRWQDRAFDVAESIRTRTAHQGFFGVNMASTGCGKTLANGRVLYALADPQKGARFVIALGLRTLTLQTGEVYRTRLGLGPEDLAVLVGGGAVRELYEHQHKTDKALSRAGSESAADLLPDNQYVHFQGSLEDGPLNRWLGKDVNTQRLLNAPILTCTIDHLAPATEGTRGGHQIAPMLRLMSSDLVLDEPDDFDTDDLPAVTRLVHWAGLLGSRVLLSSATLPPALIQGWFQAYLEGRRLFQRNRGVPGSQLNICCAWFDEFCADAGDHANAEEYRRAHDRFVLKRLGSLAKLAQKEVRRRAEIKTLPIASGQTRKAICTELATHLRTHLHNLHAHHHTIDPASHKRVSFGLIRMANIDPLVATAEALYNLGAEQGCHVHLCIYHSQHPLLVRSSIEKQLDALLNRKHSLALFDNAEFRHRLDSNGEMDHIFVVLATAVAEVGRDHDYDWAIVEPSSMRSIVQLAGRVRRHRSGSCESANLYLLDTNIRHLEHGLGTPAFCRPGFEDKRFPLDNHFLTNLLTPEQIAVIDSSNRICEKERLQARTNLVDLEHARLRALMLGASDDEALKVVPTKWWWTTNATLSGELQRDKPFRYDPIGRMRYALLPDDDGIIHFYRIEQDGPMTPVDCLRHQLMLTRGPRISFWGEVDYGDALNRLADEREMEPLACALRFGFIDLPAKGCDNGWNYHTAMGFSRFQ